VAGRHPRATPLLRQLSAASSAIWHAREASNSNADGDRAIIGSCNPGADLEVKAVAVGASTIATEIC